MALPGEEHGMKDISSCSQVQTQGVGLEAAFSPRQGCTQAVELQGWGSLGDPGHHQQPVGKGGFW